MSCSHLKLVKLCIPVVLIVFWSSCRSDDPVYDVPESPALVTLSVSSARAGSSVQALLPSGDQDKINSVYVLQFTSGSGVADGKLLYVAEGVWNGSKKKYEATLLKSTGNSDLYRVVILANINGAILYTLYGKTYAEIQQLCLSGTISGGPLSFTSAAGIPMFGVARNDSKWVAVRISERSACFAALPVWTLGSVAMIKPPGCGMEAAWISE